MGSKNKPWKCGRPHKPTNWRGNFMRQESLAEIETQQVNGLTVTRTVVGSREWWIWRNAEGTQIHAGVSSRQFVNGEFYQIRNGKWSVERKAVSGCN